ncbi:MAG TPA: hypothetical protein VML53_05370 [Thermoplasmata archaeon]|nr:hypothetical protein [Thermoplasmata archaeon]
MADRPPSLWLLTALVVVILAVAGVGGGYLYLQNHRAPAPGPKTVAVGDNVTVDYIGMFGSGPEQGRVFDTSVLSVAKNNLTWPKSLEYTPRGNKSAYVPLGVYIGPHAPKSGYSRDNVTFGQVVTGFWRGLIGLPGNQTFRITIPPLEGYGRTNASCLVTAPLAVQVPVVVSIASGSFATDYPNVTKSVGTEFTDPTYGWTDLILSTNATSVSIENLPTVGFTATPAGWEIEVTAVAAGEITVLNDIAPSQAGLLLGHSKSTVCSQKQFIVSSVDPGLGTFTENFNREVVGQTLVFVVTVDAIYP